MPIIRTAVIDDHPVFREGVISMLSRDPDFECVGEGGSTEDAVALAARLRPDMILLDVSMPGGGIDAIRPIIRASPSTRIVMLTVSEARDDVLMALEAGAAGYLLKGISKTELLGALRTVHRGGTFMDPSLAVRVIGHLRHAPDETTGKTAGLEPLTQREEEILEYVSRGLSNKEIADLLDLSHRTIKNYMTTIMMKLQVRNRVEAALSARLKNKS